MNEQKLREQIALDILDFAEKGYKGAAATEDVRTLEVAEYINTALQNAAAIARGIVDKGIGGSIDWNNK